MGVPRRVGWARGSRRVGREQGCPLAPRPLCAGATPPPARTTAGAGRPTRCIVASATAAGLVSTATCPASPVRWPRSSKVTCPGSSVPTGRPNPEVRGCAARGSPWGREPGPHAPPAAPPAGINVTHLCRNGGLCMNAGNTHHCHCQAGYTGSYCEEQVDECSPSPCRNGATCTDYPGGYSCEVGARPWGGGGVSGLSATEGQALGWEPVRQGRRDP